MKSLSKYIRLLLPLLLISISCAEVRLPGFYGNHMVLQQGTPLRIWGWADKGESVTVAIAGNEKSTTANEEGRWQVELPALSASNKAHSLKVTGTNTVELTDILIGEVWLCSGQSNMEWTVARSTNSKQEIADANYPRIRHMKVAHRPSTVPLDDVDSEWQICSPDTVANFTACGYFMARKLQKELDVPIGLVNSSWGGTRVEPWTPINGFKNVDAVQDIYQSVIGRSPGTTEYQNKISKHIAAVEEWLAIAKTSLESKSQLKANPVFPVELTPFKSHQDPTMLYNGMIHALVGFPIRGAIWYQGESNHVEGMLYYEKKKALINGWRELWKQGDFPFYYVQIAPFRYGNEDPKILARLWEAQAAVEELPKTGMVVINDIATLGDIHPPNKQDVGLRLANLALKHDYGRDEIVAHSPTMASMSTDDDSIRVTFKDTGGGLKTRDGKRPSHFEIIGEASDGFQPAVATIEKDSVVLSNPKISKPTAFRFAWNKLAEPNLTGGTGLPVGATRGGSIPQFMDRVPDAKKYELVYDLNLSRLGAEIQYDVDNSNRITKPFDRIGYLLQLNSDDFGRQNVFVSSKAFTKNLKKIGVPTAKSRARFQQSLEAMNVFSDVEGLDTGTMIDTGNIEFWSNNYTPVNSEKVAGASTERYDFGDQPSSPRNGYGSMQIHNFGKKQTIFAINAWKQGNDADLGIGNSSGPNTDWTFRRNGSSYTSKRLRVFVRTAE